MYVVSIYRIEADADESRRHDDDPFDGHEIVLVTNQEGLVEAYVDRQAKEHPTWQFHIEEV